MENPDFLEAAEAPPELQASTSLMAKAARMKALRLEIDRINSELSKAKEEYDWLRKEAIPEMMTSLGMVSAEGKGKFTLGDGSTVYLRNDLYVSCSGDKKPELLSWLEENGYGSIIRPDVHPQTLKGFVREQLERGGPVPPSANVHFETSAVIS